MKTLLIIMTLTAGLVLCANTADYVINADLDVDNALVKGYEHIVYVNDSEFEISQINLHVYADYFSRDGAYYTDRKKPFNEEKSGYTSIDSIYNCNGTEGSLKINGTMAYFYLNYTMQPGDTAEFDIYFTNKVPYPFLREGHMKGQFDLTQWYPKVAVFNKGKWADFQASRYAEFYGEFGDYDVSINIPSHYYVFGTGKQIEPASDMEFLDSIAKTGEEYSGKPDNVRKTVRFKGENITDCAFSILKEFSVIKETRDSLTVLIAAGKGMRSQYEYIMDDIFGCIEFFSETFYPYPFDYLTISSGVLNAGSGMEYPTFIIVGPLPDMNRNGMKSRVLEEVVVHEIGHQWFYYMLASNEAMEPFMDESFTNYITMLYLDRHEDRYYIKLPLLGNIQERDMYYISYQYLQSAKELKPMNFSSYDYDNMDAYATTYYMKGIFIMKTINDMMPEGMFIKLLGEYVKEFKFKHPDISDFEQFINEKTDFRYSLELKNLLYENVYTDYYIKEAIDSADMLNVKIGNNSYFNFPVRVTAEYNDKPEMTLLNMSEEEYISFPAQGIKNVTVDNDFSGLDTDYSNNRLHSGIKVHWLPGIPSFYDRNLYILPWADLNIYDRLSPGVQLYLCDLPTIDLNGIGIYGHYGFKLFAGYNILMNSPLLKVGADIMQGDDIRTVMSDNFTYMNDYAGNVFSLRAYSKEKVSYDISLYYKFRARLEDNYRTTVIMPDREGIVGIELKMSSKKGPVFLYGDLNADAANSVFYSTADYNRISGSIGAGYSSKSLSVDINYSGTAVFDSIDTFNAVYLGSDSIWLFNPAEIGSINTGFFWQNRGLGYMTSDSTMYSSGGRLRIAAGLKWLNAYCDVIHAGTELYYQAGLLIKAGSLLYADIPLYNGTDGFIAGDGVSVRIGSSFL